MSTRRNGNQTRKLEDYGKIIKKLIEGAIVTLKGNNKLKGRKMMVHSRGYDKDLNAVWLINEDGTLPTLNNGTEGPDLYDIDTIYAVNDMTIGNARKYNNIQFGKISYC